jgi:hypothetical protein
MTSPSPSDPKRELLRHTLATLAYRGGKVLRDAPPNFSEFRSADGVRTPGQILARRLPRANNPRVIRSFKFGKMKSSVFCRA